MHRAYQAKVLVCTQMSTKGRKGRILDDVCQDGNKFTSYENKKNEIFLMHSFPSRKIRDNVLIIRLLMTHLSIGK